ncbi:MAG TPA: GNAT family N-acetyltransferase [Anaerovoracaceae bacterium]|nr:GNAT family N-acetyltransferase [Anaerovoracaceae bacterium]
MDRNVNSGFLIRPAERKDAALIAKYIRELATFENELDQVTVTAENLETNMFEQNGAQAIIGELHGTPVGFAFFHQSFSTFLGKKGITLVDLYIEPEVRNRGFGKSMMAYLAALAREQDCGRLEWWCHDWNAPAIALYKKWGAFPIDNIRVYRLCGTALSQFL